MACKTHKRGKVRRYVAKPCRACDDDYDWEPSITASVVVEPDPDPQPTGLYDMHGNPLWAVDEMGPMGFDLTVRTRD